MDPARQFDFLEGEWIARCRFPSADGGWLEGQGILKAHKILSGLASLEFYEGALYEETIQGVGLRAYNRDTKQWEHTWTDTSTPGYFNVWRGVFQGDRIDLFCEWTDEKGEHVLSRLTWSDIREHSAHWESTRSADGGKTWKKYWVIDWTKKK